MDFLISRRPSLETGCHFFGGYGMVWYALRYREWPAGRSLTLPVFMAGVRGQLAVTLGSCPPGSRGGGGGRCRCAHLQSVPPCSRLLCWPGPCGPCAVRPSATLALSHMHWSGVLVKLHKSRAVYFVGGLAAEPNGSARLSDPEALYKGAWGDPQFQVTHG